MMVNILKAQFRNNCNITDDQLAFVLQHFTVRKFRKGEYIIKEGEYVRYDYFVVKGCLKAFAVDENGKESILQFAIEDWWISDYKAFWSETPASLSVDCLEDCELYLITLADREKLCKELHVIEHYFRKKSTAGYVALQQRILSLIKLNATERYELFMQHYPNLLQRLPKQLIAGYLGVSRETLSRMHFKNG
jgi:CRP-like cAMP-binding protein